MANKLEHCLLPELEETGRVLGRGAYGEVVEMLLHGTKVVGKKIHNIFFDSTNDPDYVKSMKERVQEECVRYVMLCYIKVRILLKNVILY